MKKMIIALTTFFLTVAATTAQTEFKKGFVVLNNGDTMTGLINCKQFSGWPKNPVRIGFKENALSEIVNLSISDLVNFEITGSDKYVRATVGMWEPGYILPCKCQGMGGRTTQQEVWLRLMVKGTWISLYEWNKHYYVDDNTGVYTELRYTAEEKDDVVYEAAIFKEQLKLFAKGFGLEKELSKEIDLCNFEVDEIAKIILHLNKCEGIIDTLYHPLKYGISLFAGAGLGLAMTNLYYDNSYESNLKFSDRLVPSFSLGADVSISFTSIFLRMDLSYSSVFYKGEARFGYNAFNILAYEYGQRNISAGFSVLNKFWDNDIVAVYGGMGINKNFSAYSKNMLHRWDNNTIVQDYINLKKDWLDFSFRFGAILNKKWEAGMIVRPSEKYSETPGQVIKSRIYYLTMCYHFLNKERGLRKSTSPL